MHVSAIVPAAGSGSRIQNRLGADLPKPYLTLGGIPILARTLMKLEAVPQIKEILVVCDPSHKKRIEGYVRQYGLKKIRKVLRGGATRTESVYNGLRGSDPKIRHVLIHDGVRPFIHSETIDRLLTFIEKEKYSACVLGRPIVPTVKEIKDGVIRKTLDRSVLWEIETPQVFRKTLLLEAYRAHRKKTSPVTDDASLVEALGAKVRVFPAEENNMKITTFEDLVTAGKIVGKHEMRVGWGEDRHRLKKGLPLYLGGIKIDSEMGCVGHSDGDVILHAIVDAILGALGLGDIGDYFSNKDKKWHKVRSSVFVKEVMGKVAQNHYDVVNVDTTLVLERPKLGPMKKKIQNEIAALMGLDPGHVGVKAKTAEGLGPEGRGESLMAHAVVNLRRKF